MDQIVPARHDLLPEGYAFGSIQTTRGCSLNCTFCSVTEFNGARYRQRPIAEVVEEFKSIPEIAGAHRRRQPHRSQAAAHRAGQGAVPGPGRGRHRQIAGSARPPSTSPTTKSCWIWPRRPAASGSSSGLNR